MGAGERRKGKAGEREAAQLLTTLLGTHVKRGLSQTRGGGAESPDLIGIPGIHLEVKRQKMPNIRSAMRQATSDAADDQMAVAMTRADRDGWLVTMHVADWCALAEAWLRPVCGRCGVYMAPLCEQCSG